MTYSNLKNTHTAQIVKINNKYTAVVTQNATAWGEIPSKIVNINWFDTQADAEVWASQTLQTYN